MLASVPPNSRSDTKQTSFKRKLQAFLAAHPAKQHVEQLGIRNLRIFIVTTSLERVASMLTAFDEITGSKGSGMFLFLSHGTFQQLAGPVAAPWITSRGPGSIVTM